jgi:hypothetical protein
MFNTLKFRIKNITLLQLSTNLTNTELLCNNSSKLLFKMKNTKFFSTSNFKENLSNVSLTQKSKDFFESNFRIEKAPEHISTVL